MRRKKVPPAILLVLLSSYFLQVNANTIDDCCPSPSDKPDHYPIAFDVANPGLSLADMPGDYVALQLIAFSEKEALENFVGKHTLSGLSGAAVLDSNSQTVFVLIAGIYATVEEAEQAYAKLDPPLASFQPWIRSLDSLRKALSTQNP